MELAEDSDSVDVTELVLVETTGVELVEDVHSDQVVGSVLVETAGVELEDVHSDQVAGSVLVETAGVELVEDVHSDQVAGSVLVDTAGVLEDVHSDHVAGSVLVETAGVLSHSFHVIGSSEAAMTGVGYQTGAPYETLISSLHEGSIAAIGVATDDQALQVSPSDVVVVVVVRLATLLLLTLLLTLLMSLTPVEPGSLTSVAVLVTVLEIKTVLVSVNVPVASLVHSDQVCPSSPSTANTVTVTQLVLVEVMVLVESQTVHE